MARLKQHLKDRHRGRWDRFSVYLVGHDEHLKELESMLLRIVNRAGNKQSGKFISSENILPMLNRAMTETDADRRAELIGGYVMSRRKRVKARNAHGKGALKGLVDRRLTLKGWRDGYEYTASLRRDGTIKVKGLDEVFNTPNAAARAALDKAAALGWVFWHYKSADHEWVRLATLKKG